MARKATALLAELESLKMQYGGQAVDRKRDLLRWLARATLPSPAAVLQLHEILCFLQAYPDDVRLLDQVERMLAGFSRRVDLRRHRRRLMDSGIAGTEIRYEFYAEMAKWLARCWPRQLSLDWTRIDHPDKLDKVLSLLALYCETPGLDEFGWTARDWLQRLKGADAADGAFLVRRLASLTMNSRVHEVFYESLGLPLCLAPGPDTPSRTRAKIATRRVRYQKRPLQRQRPDLRQEMKRPPEAIRPVSLRRGQELIDLARGAMVTRSRDLDVFAYGDRRDVQIIDCGDGLQFVAIGALPERRLMFEAVYGFLTLKNGVPVGYVLNSALFSSVEVAYNVFETYRGAEAAAIYGRLLAALRHMFAADTFTIYPYQLGGEGNDEALQSGAWWFYQKLGFRARDPQVLALMENELQRMRRQPGYRSPVTTLEKLARVNVYLDLGRMREDVIGTLPTGEVGLRITEYLAGRFGSDRAAALEVCSREAGQLLGLRTLAPFSQGERMAWRRWSPLVLILPGVARWPASDKEALIQVVRAKGGRRETDFVRAFDGHGRLRRAFLALARSA